MNFDRELIAALINGVVDPRKVHVGLKLTSEHIKDPFSRYMLDVTRELYKEDLEINFETLEDYTLNDRSLPDNKKTTYRAILNDLSNHEVESPNYTLERLREKKNLIETQNALRKAVEDFDVNLDPESVIEIFDEYKKGSRQIEAEVVNFNTEKAFEDRQTDRVSQQISGGLKRFKAFGWMKYLFDICGEITSQTVTAIGGLTGDGKSLMLQCIAYQAVHPNNKLNVLFIGAENTLEQIEDRFDAIFMDIPYRETKERSLTDEEGKRFYSDMGDKWGSLSVAKMPPRKFNTLDIEQIIEELSDKGVETDVLLIDSPDHMVPEVTHDNSWERKEGVYWDIKYLGERYNLVTFTSLPLQQGAGKKKFVTTEDTAGAYAIARVLDNAIYFLKNAEERLIDPSARKLQPVKTRDSKGFVGFVSLRIMDSLRLVVPSLQVDKKGSDEAYKAIPQTFTEDSRVKLTYLLEKNARKYQERQNDEESETQPTEES